MNYSRDGAIQAGDTIVGLGSPRPVLHDNIYWLLEDVARRPPSYLESASV